MGKFMRVVAYLIAGGLLGSQAVMALGATYLTHTEKQLLIIIGGSMEPLYSIGDALILDTSGDPVRNGDVITFHDDNQTLTTHRVIAQRDIKGIRYLQTQGDANEAPDPNLAPAAAVIGKPLHHIPDGGRVIAFLNSRNGRLLTYGPALLLVMVLELVHAFGTVRNTDADEAEEATETGAAGGPPGAGSETTVLDAAPSATRVPSGPELG